LNSDNNSTSIISSSKNSTLKRKNIDLNYVDEESQDEEVINKKKTKKKKKKGKKDKKDEKIEHLMNQIKELSQMVVDMKSNSSDATSNNKNISHDFIHIDNIGGSKVNNYKSDEIMDVEVESEISKNVNDKKKNNNNNININNINENNKNNNNNNININDDDNININNNKGKKNNDINDNNNNNNKGKNNGRSVRFSNGSNDNNNFNASTRSYENSCISYYDQELEKQLKYYKLKHQHERENRQQLEIENVLFSHRHSG
jgi:hypothetical protein